MAIDTISPPQLALPSFFNSLVRWHSNDSKKGPSNVQPGPIGVELAKDVPKSNNKKAVDDKCGPLDDNDAEDYVPMIDPATGEWGGPTKGGQAPEPTRFGDWERKGRCTDFR